MCVLPLVAFYFTASSLPPSRGFSLKSFFVELLSRNTSRVATAEQVASSETAPKKDQSKGPTTTVLGLSKMTPSLLDNLARRGFVSADDVRSPPTGETVAHPRVDEVVVFRDLFTAGLRMPLDPVVVDIFLLFKVFLHQMTPTSIVRLNLYMWLAKTCRLSPSAEGFARAFRVHYQPKRISVQSTGGAVISAIPQYGCYTFAFHKNLLSPVTASKNK